MNSQNLPKFVVLAILDGWGMAPDSEGNAITKAKTPNIRKYLASYPHTQLIASGQAVGLPKGEDGNTETGHLNLGAGRIVYQDLERINMAIADGSFFKNQVLLDSINHVKKYKSKLHLMGLVGAGGVHSNLEHIYALILLTSKENFKDVYLHLFTDGRDSPPTAAKTYISNLQKVIEKEKIGTIATIMGRYWPMDRDRRWDRTEKAYLALTRGEGHLVKTPQEAIDSSYAIGITDEFIEPSCIAGAGGKPVALIEENDAVIFFNFRIDRPRQLSMAFVFNDFSVADTVMKAETHREARQKALENEGIKQSLSEPFKRGAPLKNLFYVTMTRYSKSLVDEGAKVAFPPEIVDMPLGRVISLQDLSQLRATESEKERFVTFYFNGLREQPFPREDRLIIPSPKVATYDLKPEMSCEELTNSLITKMGALDYPFTLVNYPNADMVAHTGNLKPTIKAVEVVDGAVGKLGSFVLSSGGALIVTADHGNAEEMTNLLTGDMDTEHSANPVPFIVISHAFIGKPISLPSGILADVAPTVLALMNLDIPSNMTGRNLLSNLNL